MILIIIDQAISFQLAHYKCYYKYFLKNLIIDNHFELIVLVALKPQMCHKFLNNIESFGNLLVFWNFTFYCNFFQRDCLFLGNQNFNLNFIFLGIFKPLNLFIGDLIKLIMASFFDNYNDF